MIIQESLRGEAFDFDVLNDLSGRVLSVIPWRKYQSKLGETEQAETVESPVLLNLGQSLGTALGHAGPMDADIFIYNKQPYVLEINLRFAGGYPVSHLAGAGFPEKIIKLTRGETLFPDLGNYNRGIVMMKYLQIIGNPHEQFFRDTLRVTKSEYVK
jgi:carbamoyl-phosphate synthase large subunit